MAFDIVPLCGGVLIVDLLQPLEDALALAVGRPAISAVLGVEMGQNRFSPAAVDDLGFNSMNSMPIFRKGQLLVNARVH